MNETITMGQYCGESITWNVICRKYNSLFLLSEKIIEVGAFNEEIRGTKWECCDLRQWLNGVFFNTSFSDSEKGKVLNTEIRNGVSDKVFLLSLAEILHFFDNEKERQAFGTKHALDGMLGASYGKSHENISHWWWLRSMSSGPYAAANIAADLRDDRMESRAIIISQQGCLDYGGVDVNYQDVGIRPAMWIKL